MINNQPVYWKMRNGELTSIDDMDVNHLRNVLKMIVNNSNKHKDNLEKKAYWKKQNEKMFLNGDMANEFNESHLSDEDDDESKAPLFFVTQFAGEQGTLLPNVEGTRFYVDKSEDDKINSLIEQHAGTALGNALAQAKAAELIAAMRKQAPATSKAAVVVEEKAPENLDGL